MKSKGGPSVSRPNVYTYNRNTFMMAFIQLQLFSSPLLRIVISYVLSLLRLALVIKLNWPEDYLREAGPAGLNYQGVLS